jgi:protein gp37
MAENSKIAWTHHTANFWWGCFKVSDGCKNCYAETLSTRYGKHVWGPPATTMREMKQAVWKDLKNWDFEAKRAGERRRVFVSSTSDFLEDHPQVGPWREAAKVMLRDLQSLDVLLLTKRPENAPRFLADWYEDWPAHVWFGVSAESQEMADLRIPELLKVPAPIRFLSLEPLLGPVQLSKALQIDDDTWDQVNASDGDDGEPEEFVEECEAECDWINFGDRLVTNPEHREWERLRKWQAEAIQLGKDIQWVIVGGESGAKRRPFALDWVRSLLDECQSARIAFFMKQDSGARAGMYDHLPDDLKVRQFPQWGKAQAPLVSGRS